MRTVIESAAFQKDAAAIWSTEERLEFITWIAENPLAGNVVQGTGGGRKVRWTRPGTGKRGGVRVIYFDHAASGTMLLTMIYAKNDRDTVSAKDILRNI